MLRAVGHVLKNVDSKSCPEIGRANARWWKSLNSAKPEPAIWRFIKDDRDAVLKEYQYRVAQDTTITLASSVGSSN
jgi:hypothetical protein